MPVTRTLAFLRRHTVALLALALVVGSGAAFAAGTALPKNSVGTKQVKNNALKGKDLKDKSVTGADLRDGSVTGADLRDGGVTGADLSDGTVQKADLAGDAADEVRVVYYNGGGTKALWEQAGLGSLSFGLTCGGNYTLTATAFAAVSPARAGISAVEDVNAPSESAGSPTYVGATTVSRIGDVGKPVGSAGGPTAGFGWGRVTLLFQSPKLDVYINLNVTLCSASGTIAFDHKPEGSVLTRQAGPRGKVVCESTSDTFCRETAA